MNTYIGARQRHTGLANSTGTAATRDSKDTTMGTEDAAYLRALETRHYERREMAVRDEQEFLGGAGNKVITRTLRMSTADLFKAQKALTTLLDGWAVTREVLYDTWRDVTIRRIAVEVAPDQFDYMLEYGRQFWQGPEGQRMIVDLDVEMDNKNPYSDVTFSMSAEHHDWLTDLLPRLKKWGDEHHFFKGQAITADGEFVRLTPSATDDEVVLLPAIWDALHRNCIDLLSYAELYRANNIPLRRGIVLHGPPGTGKTSIGRALARRCKATFILCTPGMLETADDVKRVFKWARRFSPTILFFEDMDMVAGSRHNGGRSGVLGEFLAGLDGLNSSGGVISIATTNDLKVIEGALKDRPNRFDCILEIGPLEPEQRLEFLQRWRSKAGDLHTFDLDRVASRTDGFTGAQMQELCRLAVFEAVEQRVRDSCPAPEVIPLANAHFDAAMKRMGKQRKRKVGFNVSHDE